jgi:DtxR family Mn-dependent transcriptional regulator
MPLLSLFLDSLEDMSDLIDTTEMYLKAILEIVEIGKQPKRSALAQRLDQAMPNKNQT